MFGWKRYNNLMNEIEYIKNENKNICNKLKEVELENKKLKRILEHCNKDSFEVTSTCEYDTKIICFYIDNNEYCIKINDIYKFCKEDCECIIDGNVVYLKVKKDNIVYIIDYKNSTYIRNKED